MSINTIQKTVKDFNNRLGWDEYFMSRRCDDHRGDGQRSGKNVETIRGRANTRIHPGPGLTFWQCGSEPFGSNRFGYLRPAVRNHQAPMLAKYPTAMAGAHFRWAMNP